MKCLGLMLLIVGNSKKRQYLPSYRKKSNYMQPWWYYFFSGPKAIVMQFTYSYCFQANFRPQMLISASKIHLTYAYGPGWRGAARPWIDPTVLRCIVTDIQLFIFYKTAMINKKVQRPLNNISTTEYFKTITNQQ